MQESKLGLGARHGGVNGRPDHGLAAVDGSLRRRCGANTRSGRVCRKNEYP